MSILHTFFVSCLHASCLVFKEMAALNVTTALFWKHRKDHKCTVWANCYVHTDEVAGEYNKRSRLNPGIALIVHKNSVPALYEGWNFNSGNYLFTTDTK